MLLALYTLGLIGASAGLGMRGWQGYPGGLRAGLALALRQCYSVIPLIVASRILVGPNTISDALVMLGGCGHLFFSLTRRYLQHTNLRVAVQVLSLGTLWTAMIAVTLCSCAILGILFWVALVFFTHVTPWDFMMGTFWDPQVSATGVCTGFGVVPLLMGTFSIAVVALFFAFPVSLLIALYISEYTSSQRHARLKPMIEFLSGIPTLVYGLVGALGVGPCLALLGGFLGLSVSAESALAAGLVMGVMLVPFMVSLMDDIFCAVPSLFRESALALGATSFEYVRWIVVPGSFPGLVATLLLAVSRAMGETMIVVMVAGTGGFFSLNPLKPATTLTVHMVALLTGENSLDHPRTQAAFALGLTLFIVTLFMNIFALRTVRRYQRHAHALEL